MNKILNSIKEFWLDFFSAYYRRLKKNADYETPDSILLTMAFIQGVNFDTVLLFIFLWFPSINVNTFVILLAPMVAFALLNLYLFYYKFDKHQRQAAIARKPRYKRIVYDLYDVFSTILLMLMAYLYSLT
ncbi:hypothetical protein [Avrilella dinanensis]|uniref:Uncharacterized protein n=1 Tax=Avrilella dinanensis TaxID=2008672 RepID=A0A2M9R630_9FLAO|nr:hypothetical protein [Avrilella dinanensis]PJR04326.1 hypothetical protein CDL10_07100 [Avrilella dinanensis]